MATFLEQCNILRQEVKVPGVIAAVSGLTGLHARVVSCVQKADHKIQTSKINWKFLWVPWTKVLTSSEIMPPTGVNMWDQASFWLDAGLPNAAPLQWVDYKIWRDKYRHYTGVTPAYVTVKPNGNLMIFPGTSTATMSADYWRTPIKLVNHNQVSAIPEPYHPVVIALAKMYFAEAVQNNGMYQAAAIEYNALFRELQAHSLPGWEDDGKSQSSLRNVIEVM